MDIKRTFLQRRSLQFCTQALLTIAAVGSLAFTTTAQADFLNDFFDDAGSLTNVQKASMTTVQGMTTFSGGGLNVRSRDYQMRLLSVTPPSLKTGCNGIDMTWGSVGAADAQQIIDFVKHIGANAKVVAFQLALKALTEQLHSVLESVGGKLDWLTNMNLDSCKSAQRLVGDGSSALYDMLANQAAASDADSNSTSDFWTAMQKYSTDAAYYLGSGPDRVKKTSVASTGTDGSSTSTVSNGQTNIVFDALSKAYPSWSTSDKEFVMSITGTVIYNFAKDSDGDTTGPVPTVIGPVVNLDAMFPQTPDSSTYPINVLKCGDSSCLSVTYTTSTSYPNMWAKVRDAAYDYQSALITRDPTHFSQADYGLLTSSSVPMLDLVGSTTYQATSAFSNDVIETYSQLAAIDLTAQLLTRANTAVLKAGETYRSVALTDKQSEQLSEIKATARDNLKTLAQLRQTVSTKSLEASNYVQLLKHYQSEFRRKTAERYAAALNFGKSR